MEQKQGLANCKIHQPNQNLRKGNFEIQVTFSQNIDRETKWKNQQIAPIQLGQFYNLPPNKYPNYTSIRFAFQYKIKSIK